jgi:hypothetical protein
MAAAVETSATVAEVAITVADAHNRAAATAIKAAEAAAGFSAKAWAQ